MFVRKNYGLPNGLQINGLHQVPFTWNGLQMASKTQTIQLNLIALIHPNPSSFNGKKYLRITKRITDYKSASHKNTIVYKMSCPGSVAMGSEEERERDRETDRRKTTLRWIIKFDYPTGWRHSQADLTATHLIQSGGK